MDPAVAVNMSGASHFYPSPISHGTAPIHYSNQQRNTNVRQWRSRGPPPPATLATQDPEVQSMRRYEPPA